MQKVEVRSVLPIDGKRLKVVGKQVVLSDQSEYRFITIRNAILNDEILKDYIQTILDAPNLDRPETKPSK